MDEESPNSEGFKVTDKRRFTTEGDERAADERRNIEEKQSGPSAEKPQTPTTETKPLPPIDFASFVLQLAETTLFQLGLIRIPGMEEEVKKDVQAARQSIDFLALLEEKTRGNLTEKEQKIITETLFQLRMAFVEASK